MRDTRAQSRVVRGLRRRRARASSASGFHEGCMPASRPLMPTARARGGGRGRAPATRTAPDRWRITGTRIFGSALARRDTRAGLAPPARPGSMGDECLLHALLMPTVRARGGGRGRALATRTAPLPVTNHGYQDFRLGPRQAQYARPVSGARPPTTPGLRLQRVRAPWGTIPAPRPLNRMWCPPGDDARDTGPPAARPLPCAPGARASTGPAGGN